MLPLLTPRPAVATVLLMLVGLLTLGGCGGPVMPPLAPVTGKVTVDGKAITSGGQVSLIPLTEAKAEQVPPSSGQIDANGDYQIFTGGQAGAPLGKYKVMVTPPMMPMEVGKSAPKFPFSGKFMKQNETPLRCEVVANPPSGAYDLKLSTK